MDNKAPTINQLKKQLGPEYRIRTIDFERCLYRDFGNGFNVEISGVNSRRKGQSYALPLVRRIRSGLPHCENCS
jgi:hypothetical protein